MNKTFIISYRESTEERKYNLKILLSWLSFMQDGNIEIIIVEQDDVQKLNWLNDVRGKEFIKHIFIHNAGIFNLGWGYNIGALNSTTDILIFTHADLLIPTIAIKTAIVQTETCDIIKPYKTIIALDKIDTELFINNNYSLPPTSKHVPITHKTISGGCFIIKKNVFIMMKGFDEDCYGYGYEDNILDEKIIKLGLKTNIINNTAIHLYHKNHKDNEDIYYTFEEINKELYQEYIDMNSDEIINKINNISIWGDSNETQSKEISIRHLKREIYEKVSSEIISTLLSKFSDDYINELTNNIKTAVFNTICDEITKTVEIELKNIIVNEQKKTSLLKKIFKKFKL